MFAALRAAAAKDDSWARHHYLYGLILGASAGLFIGGMAAALLAALIHPFLPHLAELVLLSVTLFSLSIGAVVGRRVLERETFE